jgi:hypothetical protein
VAVPEEALELSVRWSRGRRTALRIVSVLLALFLVAYGTAIALPALGVVHSDESKLWLIPGGLLFVVLVVLLCWCIAMVRLRVWLRGGIIIVQGWRTRRSIPLRNAKLEYLEAPWSYTWRPKPTQVRKISLRVPIMLIKSKGVGRVSIPLVRRDILPTAQEPVGVRWLPSHELVALADAVEAVAMAPNRDLVVRFLRAAAAGEPLVRPGASVTSAWSM